MPGRSNGLGNDLRLGGAIAGGVVGGIAGGAAGGVGAPAGAAGGATMGYGLGGMAGDLLGGGGKAGPPTMESSQGAISRRAASQGQSQDLAAADAALRRMPPEYQQQYGPAIKQARYLDEQQRGMA